MMEINYTKMKRLEAEYQKKSVNRLKLAPGIPEDFRQVSYEMRNKELFVQNLLKSMEKSSQKKEFALYYWKSQNYILFIFLLFISFFLISLILFSNIEHLLFSIYNLCNLKSNNEFENKKPSTTGKI